MWISGLVTAVCTATVLILTFLAMFAGSSRGFMEDYAVVTLNTSRIGYNIFDTIFNVTDSTNTSDPLLGIFQNITNDIGDLVGDFVDGALNSIAKDLGIHDFYSGHILTYCEGFYTPAPAPNESLSLSDIHKNTTYCSSKTATFYFNPTQVLQTELDQAGHSDIRLEDLQWPTIVNDGFEQMRTAARVTFAFYCISIIFTFVAFFLAVISVFVEWPATACANTVANCSVFVAILIASSIATYVATRSTQLINENLEDIGVSASRGGKFLALTWVATSLIFISSLVWCFDCIAGRRKQSRPKEVYNTESKSN